MYNFHQIHIKENKGYQIQTQNILKIRHKLQMKFHKIKY
jgi:hypothetical protein